MKKRYMVTKYFSGSIFYEIEANSEEEAMEIANDCLDNDPLELVDSAEFDRTSVEEMEN